MILLIDNYDSFSYNLYQMAGEITPDIRVIRNDEMTVSQIADLCPECIILSPGPGRPEDAGVTMETVRMLGKTVPILGVCLGHQAVCAAYGARITYAKELMHGRQSEARFDTDCPLFSGCPQTGPVARYHSLAVDRDTIPEELKITAQTQERSCVRRAVPSGIHPDKRRDGDAEKLCAHRRGTGDIRTSQKYFKTEKRRLGK